MLTVKQAIAVTTLNTVPPLSVRDLGTAFNLKSFSLRALIDAITRRQLVIFSQVRDLSLLQSAHSLEELRAAWKSSAPSRTTLIQLSQTLSTAGGSIGFLSHDRQSVAIRGTTGSLIKVPTVRITSENYNSVSAEATAIGLTGGALLSVGLTVGNFPIAAAGLSFIGIAAFGFFELGVIEAAADNPGEIVTTIPEVTVEGQPTIPEVTVVGQPPPGVDPANVVNVPPVEISDLPEEPPPEEPPPDEPPPGGDF
jgi:hypothetical protein